MPARGELIGRVKICIAMKLRFEKKKVCSLFDQKQQAQYSVFRNWRELRNLFIFRVEFIRNSLIVFNLMLNLMP